MFTTLRLAAYSYRAGFVLYYIPYGVFYVWCVLSIAKLLSAAFIRTFILAGFYYAT